MSIFLINRHTWEEFDCWLSRRGLRYKNPENYTNTEIIDINGNPTDIFVDRCEDEDSGEIEEVMCAIIKKSTINI